MNKTLKLGKKPPVLDKRTLKFARYRNPQLVPPPAVNWVRGDVGWSMDANDSIGDCVEAAAAHMVQQWDLAAGVWASTLGADDCIKAYSAVTGYVPGDPSTDNGTDMLSFLKYWRSTGIGGHKILAFVSLRPGDLTQLREAVWLFGAVFAGVQLPVTSQNQTEWSVPGSLTGNGAPGSWGGHCIPVSAYNTASPRYRNTVITWGQTMLMTDYFYQSYCDEAYAVLSRDWISSRGIAPNQFNLDQLKVDLATITR